MTSAPNLRDLLAGLDATALTELLRLRPDVVVGSKPGSLTELAVRLADPGSLVAAIQARQLPCLQILEALTALGGRAEFARLAAFLDPGDSAATSHHAAVGHWLDQLQLAALLWQTEAGTVVAVDGLSHLFPSPLGLGTPISETVSQLSVDVLRRMLKASGRTQPAANRADVVAQILSAYADADAIRRVLDTAPGHIADELRNWAQSQSQSEDDPDYFDDDIFDAEPDYYRSAPRIDPAAYARRHEAAEWARARGLAINTGWGYATELPAEVALALRGEDYRAPFSPDPPPVSVRAIEAERLASHAAAAVTAFSNNTLAVLDRLAGLVLPALKSGGVGARELTKLAKALGCTDFDVRLVLQLCQAAHLIEFDGTGWRTSDYAGEWRDASPSEQIATLLRCWLTLPYLATETRDPDGKTLAALISRHCGGCLLGKHSVLGMAATLADATVPRSAEELAALALWNAPFGHPTSSDSPVPFVAVLAEATALGIVAEGGLTALGRAVLSGNVTATAHELAGALPATASTATFGADLTVLVVGAPAAALSRLLDSAADRESRGGAILWRFTPGSVRRAFDQGATTEQLEQDLAGIATGPLPQPLRYLIADVGRKYGNLKIAPAASIIHSADEAVLAEAVRDRSLRKIGLRLIAPTVASASVPLEQALSALRASGYLPVVDPDADQPSTVSQIIPARSAGARPAPPESSAKRPRDLTSLAALLLSKIEKPPRPGDR
jgi:hypothetical protein